MNYINLSSTMNTIPSYLKIVIGPMWSGKSTEVINIYKYNLIAKLSTLVVNFEEDKRYHETNLSTHDKVMIPCVRYSKLIELLQYKDIDKYKCVVIDEAQFFDDLYIVVEKLLAQGKMWIGW